MYRNILKFRTMKMGVTFEDGGGATFEMGGEGSGLLLKMGRGVLL